MLRQFVSSIDNAFLLTILFFQGPVAQWIERPPPKRQVGRPIRPRIKALHCSVTAVWGGGCFLQEVRISVKKSVGLLVIFAVLALPLSGSEREDFFSLEGKKFWSLGLNIGTSFATPLLIVNLNATIAPLPYSFF